MAHRARSQSFYPGSKILEVRDQYGRALMDTTTKQTNWTPNTSPTKALIQMPEDVQVNSAKIERYRKWKSEHGESQRPEDGVVTVIGTNNMLLRREVEELRKEIRVLQETNRSQNARILSLTKANGKLVTEIEANRKDLHRMASIKSGVSTLIDKHTETRSEVKSLRQQLNHATAYKNDLKEEHEQLLKDFKDLMMNAEANVQKNANLEGENQNLRDRNTALEGLVDELRATAHENLRLVLEGKAKIAKSEGGLEKAKKENEALTNLTVELSTKLQTAGIDFTLSDLTFLPPQKQQETVDQQKVAELEEDTASELSTRTNDSDRTYTSEHMTIMGNDASSVLNILESHVSSINALDRNLEKFKSSTIPSTVKQLPISRAARDTHKKTRVFEKMLIGENGEQNDGKLKREVESLEVLLKHAEEIHESGHEDEIRLQEYKALVAKVGLANSLEPTD